MENRDLELSAYQGSTTFRISAKKKKKSNWLYIFIQIGFLVSSSKVYLFVNSDQGEGVQT